MFSRRGVRCYNNLFPACQAIATNPTSVFLIGSLVASTVLASQVSSMALVGQTLTFNTNQGGLIRLLLDVVTSVMRGFDSIASDRLNKNTI